MARVADGVVLDGGFGVFKVNIAVIGISAIFHDTVFQNGGPIPGSITKIDALPVSGGWGAGIGSKNNRRRFCP